MTETCIITCLSYTILVWRSGPIPIVAAREADSSECVTGVTENVADDKIQFPSSFAVLFFPCVLNQMSFFCSAMRSFSDDIHRTFYEFRRKALKQFFCML
jgi:hypothetical protein